MVLVTTINFEQTIEIGDPISQAKIFDAQSADELIFLDLDASRENRDTLAHIIKNAAELKVKESDRLNAISNGLDKNLILFFYIS